MIPRGGRSSRLALASATALLAAALLAGCTATAPGSDADTGDGGGGSGLPPTCETIIARALVAQFEDLGWTARTDPFYIGPHEVPGGVSCTWGDFEVEATDVVQMYGWAPIEAGAATKEEDFLVEQGWRREEGDGVVYLTESSPSAEWADDEGYGMTYAFGDGWVALSDTKSGLDVITWQG